LAQAALNKAAVPRNLPWRTTRRPISTLDVDNCATDVARQNLEQQAISRSPVAEVQVAAMVKYNLRLQATVGTLAGQVGAAQAAAAAAN
jgi:hypothetical protein